MEAILSRLLSPAFAIQMILAGNGVEPKVNQGSFQYLPNKHYFDWLMELDVILSSVMIGCRVKPKQRGKGSKVNLART